MWIDTTTSPPTLIKAPRQVRQGEWKHTAALFSLWSDAERAAIGIYPAQYDDAAPSSVHVAGAETITFDGSRGHVTRAWAARPVAEVKAEQAARLEDAAETRRQALSAPLAGKRDAYLLKAELAVKAELGDEAAKQLLAAEAAARGTDEPTLRGIILAKRTAWTASAMAIETAEAATKAAIAAAVDGPAAVAAADAGIAALEVIK